FFLAFLPQFVEPDRGPAWAQILALGLLFAALGFLSDGTWALVAGTLGERIRRSRRFPAAQRYVSGSVFVGLGAVAALTAPAEATERLRLGTGVTCPMIRIHPAIVAQAAATSKVMMEGRFFLGVGTGEELNEHVVGARWPGPQERLEMLEEAIEVMRLLWQGGYQSHYGKHYTVEQARIFTLPDEPPPIAAPASQPNAAELAG